jgi:Carbohydrate esterase 2 N-terminal
MASTRVTTLLLGLGLAALACSSDPAGSDGTEDTSGSGGEIPSGSGGTQVGSAGNDGSGGSGGSGVASAGGAAGSLGSGGAGGRGGSGGSVGAAGSVGAGGSGGGALGAAGPRLIGRYDAMNQSGWSGSSIELRFNAPAVSVTMSGANLWYTVVVDGGAPKKMQIGTTGMLATGLAAGPHVVTMTRRAEAFNGIAKFVSFSIPETAMLPQQIPNRRLEVIGDSFAVAYGIDGCGDRTNGDENAYMSWGLVLGRLVNADVHILGQSGMGMAFSLDGSTTFTIPSVYGLTLGTQNQTKWDFSKYIPDAVLIDVGENDQNAKANGTPVYNAATFKQKYSDFLTSLRGYYPNAYIYCGSHGDLMTDIPAMVTAKADPKIKFIKFDGTRTACDFHPDVPGHAAYAATAAAALKADLGW